MRFVRQGALASPSPQLKLRFYDSFCFQPHRARALRPVSAAAFEASVQQLRAISPKAGTHSAQGRIKGASRSCGSGSEDATLSCGAFLSSGNSFLIYV